MRTLLYSIIVTATCCLALESRAESTINGADRHAYAANAGWIDCRADVTNGMVAGEFYCSGYAYGSNLGWIHFGDGSPANGYAYANDSSTDYGVNHDGVGRLHGYAYGANVGWIKFEDTGDPNLDLLTGNLSGYTYGANVGWISLSNLFALVQTDSLEPGPDTDADMLPDAWEHRYVTNLTTLSTANDLDEDGTSDADEYVAGTDPTNSGSLLAITALDVDPVVMNSEVTWQSVESRLYEIHFNADLSNDAAWVDSSLGQQIPDPGISSTRTVSLGGSDADNYRVKAIRPLAP